MCKAKAPHIDVPMNLINAVVVQTYRMFNFSAAQMDFSRERKFVLCIHSAIGAHMMCVMEERANKNHLDSVTGKEGMGPWGLS